MTSGELTWGRRLRVPRLSAGRVRGPHRSGDVSTGAVARFGGDGGNAPYVTVYVARSAPEAEIIRSHLESEGIPSLMRSELVPYLYGAISIRGIDIQVPRTLADRAVLVLNQEPAS